MVIPDVLTSNAFRVLRASVTCTAAEAHKAAMSLKRAASLGTLTLKPEDLPELGDVARDEQALRMAIGRVENAAQRVRDRLFWYSQPRREEPSAEGDKGVERDFEDVARAHDAALYRIAALYSAPFTVDAPAQWAEALRQWHQLVTNSEYRRLALAMEEQSRFEPAALTSEIESALADAVRLAGEPLSTAGHDAMLREDNATIFSIVLALTELEDTGRWASAAQEELLARPLKTLRDACEHTARTYGERIVRKQDQVLTNVVPCAEALAYFRSTVQPALVLVQRLAPSGHSVECEAREMTALALFGIGTDHTWAEKFDVAVNLAEEALALASGTRAALRIEQPLGELRVIAQRRLFAAPLKKLQDACEHNRRTYGEAVLREPHFGLRNAKPCAAALAHFHAEVKPALAELRRLAPAPNPIEQKAREMAAMTLHSIGIDHTWAESFGVAVKLNEKALTLAKGTPEAARIQEALGKLRELAHRERVFAGMSSVTSAPSLRTVNGMGFGVYGSSDYDPKTDSYVTTHCFCVLFIPVFPLGRYRVIRNGKSYRFLGSLPLTKANRVHLWGAIAACVGLFLMVALSDPNHRSRGSYRDRSSESDWRPSYATGQVETPRQTSGITTAADLAGRIQKGNQELAELEPRLRPLLSELKDLRSGIEAKEAVLGRPGDPGTKKASVTPAVAKQRKLHDDLVQKYAELYKANASEVDRYERLVADDKALKEQYNELVAR